MDTSPALEQVKELLLPFNSIPNTALPFAHNLMQKGFASMGINPIKYKKDMSSTIRTLTREYFEKHPFSDWTLDNHVDRLHLVHKKTGTLVRFLKKTDFGNGLPKAGHNIARINDWLQPSIYNQKDIFGKGVSNLFFVIAWSFAGNRFSCAAYHPIGTGNKGVNAPADMMIQLGIDDSLYREAKFIAASEENELFMPKMNTIITERNSQSNTATLSNSNLKQQQHRK